MLSGRWGEKSSNKNLIAYVYPLTRCNIFPRDKISCEHRCAIGYVRLFCDLE